MCQFWLKLHTTNNGQNESVNWNVGDIFKSSVNNFTHNKENL